MADTSKKNTTSHNQDQEEYVSSFSKALFSGHIDEQKIFPYPSPPKEDVEMLSMTLEAIEKFAKDNIDSHKIDEQGKISEEVLQGLKDLGLFGMNIPQEYGGLGFSATSYARAIECLAGIDGSVAVTVGAHQSIGLKGILLAGTEEQKRKYLPELATGKRVAAFALTEPLSGSDAQSMKTEFKKLPNGNYVLNGSKLWITNGGFADVFVVFAKGKTTRNGVEAERVSAFIVERSYKGFSNGPEEKKMGIKGSSTVALFLDNVEVPKENLLAEEGRGFKLAMEILNSGRMGLAAGCIGSSKKMLKASIQHANERKQFGKPIGEYGMIKEKIARMVLEIFVMESMVYMSTAMVDRHDPDYSLESAICKVYCSEANWRVINDALQIAGGTGFMKEYAYEQTLRDSRINLIFEGTNEILRLFISLAGMQGPGEHLKEVASAMKSPLKSYGLISEFIGERIAKSMPRGLVGGNQIQKAHALLKNEASIIEEVVADFEMNVTKLFWKHGKSIVEKQFALRRVADIALELYAMLCVLSRVSNEIEKKGAEKSFMEIHIAKVFIEQARRRAKSNIKSFDKNVDEPMKEIASKSYEIGAYFTEGVLKH